MVSWLETLKAKSQKVRKIGKRTQNIGKIGKIRGFVIYREKLVPTGFDPAAVREENQ